MNFRTIDDFELGKPLGKGQYGHVWLAREKKTGYIVALKIVSKSRITNKNDAKPIRRELEIHLSLNSPYILQMYGYFYDKNSLYYILEYAPTDMYRQIQIKGRFSEQQTVKYVIQLMKALTVMQQFNIIHRDIKPENILIGVDGNVKIADFGWAVCNINKVRYTFCGTMEYLAPEMIKEQRHGDGIDIWCLGIITFEMLVGTPPFEIRNNTNNQKLIMEAIQKDICEKKFVIPSFVDNFAKSFISKILVDLKQRPTLPELFQHEWIQNNL